MKKKVLVWVLAAVLLLSMVGCSAANVSSTNDQYVGMEPAAAAEAAAAETKDTASLSDIIRVPFGFLLDWLYTFTNNYGLALILFSLIIKLVLLPMSVKSKKSMLKMSRLSPQVKALESKYGDDKQKYQLAVQQLYKEEGVSMGGGCLWSFIPLIILLPLYYIIREPITYMMHNPQSTSAAIVAFMQASGVNLGKNAYYAQLAAAGHIGEFMDDLKALAVTANANLQAMNFQFLGIDLSGIPSIKFWECEGWGEIGLFLIPVVSAGLQAASMWISQKMNNQVATFGAVQDYFLTKHYRKVYEEEDAVRQELAAKRRAEEAEKERQRALRREQNPDGITDNVSKKKIRQQEKEAAEKAARDYEAKKNPVPESEVKKPLSGDPERPYCRGRAYDPSHYGRKRAAESDAEQTKE